jgi:hypothetical protein
LVKRVVEVAGGGGVLELLLAGKVVKSFGGGRPLHGLFYLAGKEGRGRCDSGKAGRQGEELELIRRLRGEIIEYAKEGKLKRTIHNLLYTSSV